MVEDESSGPREVCEEQSRNSRALCKGHRSKAGLQAKELLLGVVIDRGGKAQEVRTSAQN